jgi:hypothetical protein
MADSNDRWPWVNNPGARQKLKETFAEYAEILNDSIEPPAVLTRVQYIHQGLSAWHPEDDAAWG